MAKHLILVINLLLFSNFCFCQNDFEDGKKEYLNGDFEKSIILLTKSIENKQEVAAAIMYRGIAKAFLGQSSAAISDLNASARLDAANPKLYFYFGKTYLLTSDYKAAVSSFTTSILIFPGFAPAYDGRARAKTNLKEYPEALADEGIAIKLDANNEKYYINRGHIKFLMAKNGDAISDFDKSINIKPTYRGYGNRGFVYTKLKNYRKSIEDFTKALEINSNLSDVLYARGSSYKLSGRRIEAYNDFQKSIKLGYSQSLNQNKEDFD